MASGVVGVARNAFLLSYQLTSCTCLETGERRGLGGKRVAQEDDVAAVVEEGLGLGVAQEDDVAAVVVVEEGLGLGLG